MRVPVLKVEELSPRQKAVHDRIAGRRGRVGGPYPVWLHNPELCERAEALSAYVRFETGLPLKLRELSILAMLLNTFLVDLKKPPPFADIRNAPYER